jgi:hypothetical protein
MKKRIVIAGGSGFIGKAISNHYLANGYEVVVLTRGETKLKDNINFQHWDGKSLGKWLDSLSGAEALINLSGKSINCRFTEENKKALINSRVSTTTIILEAIKSLENPPELWVNASAGAMYQVGEKPNVEDETKFSNSFLSKMALAWEDAFYKDNLPKTRRASIRISLILGKGGGVYPVFKKITSLYLGGAAGSGKQYISWMHIEDAVRAIDFIITSNIEGPVNFSTNNPKSNKVFMKTLRRVLGVSFGIPAPAFGIRFFSRFIGVEPTLLLDSVNFIPQKLNDNGFKFNYDQLNIALEDLK